ncbi:MAG: hypothetical protein ACKV0T_26605 [Planctomycetales bacterium]
MRVSILRGVLWTLVLGLMVVGDVQAAGPGGSTAIRGRGGFSKTVTTTVNTATLEPFDTTTEPNGSGTARYTVVTVDISIFGRTWSSTHRTLSVTASGLSDPDGTQLALELNVDPTTDFGSATVSSGSAAFNLSTKRGDVIPQIVDGDHLDVILAGSSPSTVFLVHGDFGPPVTTVTTCGR